MAKCGYLPRPTRNSRAQCPPQLHRWKPSTLDRRRCAHRAIAQAPRTGRTYQFGSIRKQQLPNSRKSTRPFDTRRSPAAEPRACNPAPTPSRRRRGTAPSAPTPPSREPAIRRPHRAGGGAIRHRRPNTAEPHNAPKCRFGASGSNRHRSDAILNNGTARPPPRACVSCHCHLLCGPASPQHTRLGSKTMQAAAFDLVEAAQASSIPKEHGSHLLRRSLLCRSGRSNRGTHTSHAKTCLVSADEFQHRGRRQQRDPVRGRSVAASPARRELQTPCRNPKGIGILRRLESSQSETAPA